MTKIIRRLTELRADHVLILAAVEGRILSVTCAMPFCACPNGRSYFERRGNPRWGAWAPSADRWPLPGRAGGTYVTTNVRLAHKRCNQIEGGKAGALIAGNAGALTRKARGDYESEAHRARSRRGMKTMRETWGQTPEAAIARRNSGLRGAAGLTAKPHGIEARRRGGLAGVHALLAWQTTDAARMPRLMTPARLAALAKARCAKGIKAGHQCQCGQHRAA